MIRTKTECTYICDNCNKEESMGEVQESGVDGRYSDYGSNFNIDLEFRMPQNWTFIPERKIICSSDCLMKFLDKVNEKAKEVALEKYSKTVQEYLEFNKKQIDNLKK